MKRKSEECVRLYATSSLIRSLMTIGGITVQELASQAGVAKSTAHSFMSATMVDTSAEQAEKYAAALRVRTDLLFIPMRSTLTPEELASPGPAVEVSAA